MPDAFSFEFLSAMQLVADPAPSLHQAPNLAGLARTCEIFNASALVLGSLRVLEDSLFKQVRVCVHGAVQRLAIRD